MLDDALCARPDVDPEMFFANLQGTDETTGKFSDLSLTARRAQKMCQGCPVKEACLNLAMANETTQRYRWGIWGGLTPNQRHELAKERRAA
jgi:WhiB family transcriptional regulator, redox-sensing transcriptional regulator